MDMEIIIGLVTIIVVLAFATRFLTIIPAPVIFTLGGLLLSGVPRLSDIALEPKLIFLLFLPPILFYAAYHTSWRDFVANIRPISLLALVLVAFTTMGIAVLFKYLIPAMPWAVACVLGAIISPPDAVSATAVTHRLKIPHRIITILEGESLVNDASALVIYKIAVVAVLIHSFSIVEASLSFVITCSGGILLGLILGWLMLLARKYTDVPVSVTISLLTPFVIFMLAEKLGVSGVLAVVMAGLIVGWLGPKLLPAATRLRTVAVWETLNYLLQGVVFILIGLQLPVILANLGDWSYAELALFVTAMVITIIVIRFIWVFFATYVIRAVFPSIRRRDPYPAWQGVVIIAWAGMRGIVTLGAALALPFQTALGEAFPMRNLIIFLAFASIIGTLVFQGATLPLLIKWLGIQDDEQILQEEQVAREAIGKAMLSTVENLAGGNAFSKHALEIAYRECLIYSAAHLSVADSDRVGCAQELRAIRQKMITAARLQLINLREHGVISGDILHAIQAELDLDEIRLS